MTLAEIKKVINEQANNRLDETIDYLLVFLRNKHTHQSYIEECYCDYCTFIRCKYTPQKLNYHHLKRKIYILTDGDPFINYSNKYMNLLYSQQIEEFSKIQELKRFKKVLMETVL